MNLKEIADATIPAAQNKFIQIKKRYSTGDIVKEVLECFRQSNWQVKNLAPYLKGPTIKDTCHNIWNFLHEYVKYKVDPDEVQWVKEPAKTWADKRCDCKSYSIFIASLLYWLGIKGCFRFVSFNNDPNPTHVYIVVRNQGQDIIIDDVMPRFNAEKPYKSKNDYSMQGLYRVSGLPTVSGSKDPKPGQFVIDKYDNRKKRVHASPAGKNGLYFIGPDHEPVRRNEFKFPVKRRNKIGYLPVMGCMEDDAEISGLFDNIFRGVKKVLSSANAKKYMAQLFPTFIYRYLPNPNMEFVNAPNLASFYASLPEVVKKKQSGINDLIHFIHDKWAQDNSTIGHTVHNILTGNLGMEPQHYLSLVINPIIDTFKLNSYLAVGKIDWTTTAVTTGGAAAAGGPAAPATAAAAFLANIAVGLSAVDLPDGFNIQNIAPMPGDWDGYPTRLPTFVVAPTLSDPLGAGINNGLYDSNGNPLQQAIQQDQIPVIDTAGNQVNNAPALTPGNTVTPSVQKAGMSPLLMIGLAGAAVAMFAGKGKGKKKKGGRK